MCLCLRRCCKQSELRLPPAPACRVFDVQKHYWGATIIARGYRVLYMVRRGLAGWLAGRCVLLTALLAACGASMQAGLASASSMRMSLHEQAWRSNPVPLL